MTKDYNITIKKLPQSLVEISGELSWEKLKEYEQKAFARLSTHVEVDGFRKGNVPEAIARKQLSDELILSDMVELAIQEYYPKIAKEEGLDLIGRPTVSITKLARENALGFSIVAATVPEIVLPKYKTLAKNIGLPQPTPVTPEEIEKVVEELRQMRAYGHVHTAGDTHQHTEELPEVNDEFAKSFGNFTTLADMKEKIKENLLREKDRDNQDKRRLQILESLLAETKFDVPDILIASEQEKMLAQIEAEITRAGMSIDDYLEKSKKTREEVLAEYKPEAEKRARMQLLINAIAKDANLNATDEEVDRESKQLLETYPGADVERTRAYADMVLTNEKVLKMLEESN